MGGHFDLEVGRGGQRGSWFIGVGRRVRRASLVEDKGDDDGDNDGSADGNANHNRELGL